MKQFLLALALGMRPAKIYNGTDSAVEGILLVDGCRGYEFLIEYDVYEPVVRIICRLKAMSEKFPRKCIFKNSSNIITNIFPFFMKMRILWRWVQGRFVL